MFACVRWGVLLGLMPVLAAHASTRGELMVHISGIRVCQGTLMLAVYDKADGFLQAGAAVLTARIPLASAPCEPVVSQRLSLPYGRYALAVYQDANDNGELDSNWLGRPIEFWGVSNRIRPIMRAPRFAESAFDFSPDRVEIPLDLR
jgi:uncharacterized protein (DUF2141 family)